MCQKHTDISETSKILLKIYYKFCEDHNIINWFIMKRQIILMNRKTETNISKNKKKIQRESQRRTNNITNKSEWTVKICTLQNYLNRRTLKQINQKENSTRQIHKKNS